MRSINRKLMVQTSPGINKRFYLKNNPNKKGWVVCVRR
jgi:hypothetical protein